MNCTIRRVARVISILMLVVVTSAGASHDEPKRAKTVKAPLVTAYQPCINPNTVTVGFPPLAACQPALRMDERCGFSTGTYLSGHGRAVGRAKPNGDFEVTLTAKGLNLGCEGWRLCGAVRVRATTHRCEGEPCTVQDIDFIGSSPTACCTVAGGLCVVKTTINSEVLGTLVVGDRTGVEVFGFGLKRETGPDLPDGYTFTSGGLTP